MHICIVYTNAVYLHNVLLYRPQDCGGEMVVDIACCLYVNKNEKV